MNNPSLKYRTLILIFSSVQGLITTCNKECGCTTAAFEPICDTNHTVYFSPCHAGCTNVSTVNGVKVRFASEYSSKILKGIYVSFPERIAKYIENFHYLLDLV